MKVMYKPPATAAPASGAMGATGASPTEETQGQAPHIQIHFKNGIFFFWVSKAKSKI